MVEGGGHFTGSLSVFPNTPAGGSTAHVRIFPATKCVHADVVSRAQEMTIGRVCGPGRPFAVPSPRCLLSWDDSLSPSYCCRDGRETYTGQCNVSRSNTCPFGLYTRPHPVTTAAIVSDGHFLVGLVLRGGRQEASWGWIRRSVKHDWEINLCLF